jgi:hypothetical protein
VTRLSNKKIAQYSPKIAQNIALLEKIFLNCAQNNGRILTFKKMRTNGEISLNLVTLGDVVKLKPDFFLPKSFEIDFFHAEDKLVEPFFVVAKAPDLLVSSKESNDRV